MSDAMAEQDEVEQSDLEQAIAEQVATLSQAAETPTEVEPPSDPLEADEVDFRSGGWRSALAEVQDWLRLPHKLTLRSPEEFTRSLADALDYDDVSEAVESADQTRLTDSALGRLNVRLQQAIRLQEQFLSDLETEGSSVTSATGRWLAAWEESDPDEGTGAGPVSAKAETWPINEFSVRAADDELNLSPSYQRGDVWPTSDSQQLIESILRGIPLPSVIVLQPDEPEKPYEIVDGKQRLTSILRFIGKHPRALQVVKDHARKFPDKDFEGLFDSDYPRFRRLWKNVTGEQLTATKEREYYFPFKLRSGSTPLAGNELGRLQGKYYTQIKTERLQIADETVTVRQLFERMTKYKIPVIEYSRATRQQIHEVFNLYNKQGKHLNAEEIRNALYHDLDLMRAILVVAGDNRDVAEVAPFLLASWQGQLELVGGILDGHRIGTARYRRSKVLSWLAAMLLFDSMENDKPKRLATARHIDALLHRVQGDTLDPLRTPETIVDAFGLILTGMDAHAAVDEAWDPRFRDTKAGAKWQELQLIASLLGVILAAAVVGGAIEERLAEVSPTLRELTASKEWQRPKKTQTATQWDYIAQRSLDITEVLGVDLDEASSALRQRFGYSCVPTLRSIAAEQRSS
jgi:hypothetical protein